MLNFTHVKDPKTGEEYIETSLAGKILLNNPQLNKGTSFTEQERHVFGLLGKLPVQVEPLEEQVKRAYLQFQGYNNDLQRNIYLNNLHDKNQVLFYKLVSDHLSEMLPLIYTPIVGNAVKQYSREFRQARGLYIAYPYGDRIEEILDNRSHPQIDLIVVTDGEGVLGIGDQGVGGMDIPIAKLMVYTLCGGISPLNTLPILLDVGTDNELLLNDPLYLGLRHKRIRGKEYDDFIQKFIAAIQKKFPHVFLQWEDFGRENAKKNLDLYHDKLCSFNDDIQGTGVVTMATIMAAAKANNSTLKDQRIVIFGAGAAGTGIADQICAGMQHAGMTLQEARARLWLIDRPGLLTTAITDVSPGQRPYLRDKNEVTSWALTTPNKIDLLDTIKNVRPTILIGCSAQAGAFNQTVIEEMIKHVARPLILPLSNPTDRVEAHPLDVLQWSNGKALIATGSPFPELEFNGKKIRIAQCNNALVFPGIGLGVIATQATRLTDAMLWAACTTLSDCSPILKDPNAPLLPTLDTARDIARNIACAVGQQAQQEGFAAKTSAAELTNAINNIMWHPHYVPLRKI